MGGTAMQFVRVISRVEQMEIWHANRNGFSFVISYESRSGPGLQGRTGFVASWRPVDQNRSAIRVGGSPFNTLAEAEEACEAMLGHLTIGPIAPAGIKVKNRKHPRDESGGGFIRVNMRPPLQTSPTE
jgi:hypothetical protein